MLSSEEINVKLIAEQIQKRDISLDDMNNDKYSFKRNDLQVTSSVSFMLIKCESSTCNEHDKYFISRRFVYFQNSKERLNFTLSRRSVLSIKNLNLVKKNVI